MIRSFKNKWNRRLTVRKTITMYPFRIYMLMIWIVVAIGTLFINFEYFPECTSDNLLISIIFTGWLIIIILSGFKLVFSGAKSFSTINRETLEDKIIEGNKK